MRLFRALIILSIGGALSVPIISLAQQTPSPKDFFTGGYVQQNPARSSVQPTIVQEGHTPKSIGKDALASHKDTTIRKESPEETDATFVTHAFDREEEDGKEEIEEPTLHIDRIALLLNASTADESFRHIKIFGDMITKYDIPPEAIYTMQIPPFVVRDAPNDWARVIIRGGSIEMNRKIAEQYQITRLPAWIARTNKGDVVLEGYEDIDKFLNMKGELRTQKLKQLAEEVASSDTAPSHLTPEELQQQQAKQVQVWEQQREKLQDKLFKTMVKNQQKQIEQQQQEILQKAADKQPLTPGAVRK